MIKVKSNSNVNKVGKVFSGAGPVVALVLLAVVLSIVSSSFLSYENITNILKQTSVNSMIAIGMLVVLLTGGIDLSVGSTCALSSCLMGVAMRDMGIENSFLLIIICVISGLLGGLINGLLYTGLDLPTPFIATLGTMQIYRGLAQIVTNASPITGFPNGVKFLGAKTIAGFPVCFLAVVVVFIIFSIFLNSTALGKKIYSVGGNKEASRVSGIDVKRIELLVYVIAGLMSGIAALVLTGRVGTALPTTGDTYAMDAIASCVIGGASFNGGKGTVLGTFIGALLVQMIRNGLNLMGAQSDVQSVVIGIVVIGAVYMDVRREKSSQKSKRQAQAQAHQAEA